MPLSAPRLCLAAPLALLLCAGCAATSSTIAGEDDDEAPPAEVEAITSSSVRIRRQARGPVTAQIETGSEVREVLRVVELLAARGARRVNLKIEGGASAVVLTRAPKAQAQWLVVASSEGGLKLFVATTSDLLNGKWAALEANYPPIPPRDGKPDLDALSAAARVIAASTPKLAGACAAAVAQARAEVVIDALARTSAALPGKKPNLLIAW